MSIRFGTDGWRAVIAEEFTFTAVRRACAGIAKAMAESEGPVVVGYDTRFLSRRFAETAARTLIGAGRRVLLSDSACPTPAASCHVVASRAAFGVVITASHNPAAFSGIKVKESTGASAGSEVTRRCEQAIPEDAPPLADVEVARSRGQLEEASFTASHVERLSRMVDLEAIRSAGLRVIVDPMHGAAGRLLERLLSGRDTQVSSIRSEPDPLFGGVHPEPLEQNLEGLRGAVVQAGGAVGFATDGDGDRIGAFDERGRFVSPLRIAPLLAWSLIKKGRRGPIGKTFANTLLLDRIASHYGLPFGVYPVGFKHIAAEMQAGRMLLGGEESGGIGVEGFIPERDGTLVSLMLLQAMVDEGKPLSALVEELTRTFGELHYRRVDYKCSPEDGLRLVERLAASPPASIGGLKVTATDPRDGLKLLFGDDGWVLFRPSGTEPVLRVYSEAPTAALLDAVMGQAATIAQQALDGPSRA